MIKGIRKRIFLGLFLTTSILILILGTVSFLVSNSVTFRNYKNLRTSEVLLSTESFESKMNINSDMISALNSNQELVDAIKNNSSLPQGLQSTLDAYRIMSGGLGAYLYSSSRLLSYSSNIYNPLDYESFKTIEGMEEFLRREDQESFISIRNYSISGSFASSLYNKDYGIISLIRKLYDDGGLTIAYIVIDFSPNIFYQSFAHDTFITVNSIPLKRSDIDNKYNDFLKNSYPEMASTKNNKYLAYSIKQINDTVEIYHFSPLSGLNQKVLVRGLVILSIVVFSIGISVYVSNRISKWIYDSLYSIKEKIEGVGYEKE